MIIAYTLEDELETLVYEKTEPFFNPPEWIAYAPSWLSMPLFVCWLFTIGVLGCILFLLLALGVLISWPFRRPIQLLLDYIEEKIRLRREKKRLRKEYLESLEGKIDIHYQP